ncbi:acetate--CoA ligase family protein [Actinomadura atramentaria]|uniref:acetate--CoA ligase family protein n=1 Tax=Actinomadura atramentaria TaxID=1990 RepID=UPI00036A828B|nr:acetate--CoA ligase family protein [Actinomadura atramentaria]
MAHLPEHVVKEWVAGFGVRVPRGATAAAPGDVGAAAAGLAPPLVVKAFGPDLLHKSGAGAVRLGLASAAEAADAAARMGDALAAAGTAVDGFLVEEQAEPGLEMIVGAVRDPVFGPVLAVGLGGVFTEALADVSLRVCPVTESDVREMLDELRGAAVLHGYRGRAVDVDALVAVILAVGGADGVVAALGGRFGEFELNPVICGPAGAVAVDARRIDADAPPDERQAPPADFDRLFAPRGVAVVGASTRRPNFGNMFLGFYRAAGFAGDLVAVHPEADEIDGVPCVPSLAAAKADYALVAVPAERCADVVRGAAGIPFVQVMSSGFGELGRADLEEDLAAAAREAGVRLLGPNCMGVYSPAGGQTFLGGTPGRPGRIALVSQSGGLAGEVIRVGERRGLAFAKAATVGNGADVGPAELVRYLSADPGVSAIGLYLEAPRDGRALFAALADAVKPVVALVGGRSRRGRAAAASHTGALAGDHRIWPALAAQTGTALVASQDDLIGVLDAFDLHAHRAAPGEGVLVIGPSGGAGVLATDVFDAAGLDLPPLPDAARTALRGLGVGAGSSLANPLEIPLGPRADPALVRHATGAVLAGHAYADVVAHVNVQSFFTFGNSADPLLAYAREVAALQESAPDTRVTLVMRNAECAPPGVEDAVRDAARAAGVPVYRGMEAAATAVAAVRRHRERRQAGSV